MSLTSEGLTPADISAVVGNDRNNGFFGGDGLYAIIVLFILMAVMNNGFGFGGGMGGGGAFPWLLASGNNTNNDVQRGFDQAAITGAINNVGAAVNAISPQLCNGFAGVNATINSGFANSEVANNARQMASMNQLFAMQTAQQNCCCENRAGLADVKYTIATENCQDRYEAAQNTRDIIENCNRNNQAVLDKLCALELDGVRSQLASAERENLSLQNQLNMATMQASQTAQTAQILAGQAAEIDGVYNRLKNCPVGTYSVCNPVTPVGYGCGCGA